MKVFYDLHIHSALSPCAEPEMTPNNIINMAVIKALDVIAICDHNAIGNVAAAQKVIERDQLPITLVPGIEVQTKEDVHVLCLFKTYQNLEAFYNGIAPYLQQIPHNAKRFGDQMLLDEEDELVGTFEWSLYASYSLSVDEILARAINLGGQVIPAHLDRGSYSMISNLGFISPDLSINTVEFSPQADIEGFLRVHPQLKKYRHVVNSDAHELIQISEAEHFLECDNASIESVFAALFSR